MLQAKTGTSTNSCAKTAGMEAAKKAKEGLPGVKVALAYGSCAYDLDAMLAGIAEELPGVPVIGNTSYTGVITEDGYVGGGDHFLGMMTLALSLIHIFTALCFGGVEQAAMMPPH